MKRWTLKGWAGSMSLVTSAVLAGVMVTAAGPPLLGWMIGGIGATVCLWVGSRLLYESLVNPSRAGERQEEATARLIAAAPDLLEAHKIIARGEGAFNRDPLKHAINCIDEMKAVAQAAIDNATRGHR